MRNSAVLQMPAPIDGLLQRHESVILTRSFGTVRRHSTASPRTSLNRSALLPSVRQSLAPCGRLNPTKPAVPSLSLLFQTVPFHPPQLSLGRQTTTLLLHHLRLPAQPNGVHGLSVYVTFDPLGWQRRLRRPQTCGTLATPVTLPPTLTRPLSPRRASVTLMLSFDYVPTPPVVPRRLSPLDAT